MDRLDRKIDWYAPEAYSSAMTRKRVPLNISLPDEEFKVLVETVADERGISPSQEFVALYTRLAKRYLSPQ